MADDRRITHGKKQPSRRQNSSGDDPHHLPPARARAAPAEGRYRRRRYSSVATRIYISWRLMYKASASSVGVPTRDVSARRQADIVIVYGPDGISLTACAVARGSSPHRRQRKACRHRGSRRHATAARGSPASNLRWENDEREAGCCLKKLARWRVAASAHIARGIARLAKQPETKPKMVNERRALGAKSGAISCRQ